MNNYSYQSYQGSRQMEPNYIPSQSSSPPGVGGVVKGNIFYAEYILNQNIGKKIKVYMSFADSIEWRDRIFEGTLEAVGREFLLISDRQNNKWYMLWSIYIDFLEFSDEVIF